MVVVDAVDEGVNELPPDRVGADDEAGRDLVLHAEVDVNGVRCRIGRIVKTAARLGAVDITDGEIVVVWIDRSEQLGPNVRKDGEQLRSSERGRLPKIECAAVPEDLRAGNN